MSFRLVCDYPPFMTAVTHPVTQRLSIMHLSTRPPKAMKPTLFSLSAAACAAIFALTAQAETHVSIDLGLRLGVPPPIVVREAPPRPTIVERQYASPGSGYVWVAGRNTWRDGRWVWVSGGWVRPPQPNAIYVEGRWDERSRNWTESHWEVVDRRDNGDHWDRHGSPGVELIVEAPPPPRHERMSHRPSSEHMWVEGFWARRGHRYEWVAGHWELPPHGHQYWVAPRYEHRDNSYVFVEGRWR